VRLFHKLVLLILVAALAPLAALGLLSARSAESALARRIEEHHRKLAQNGADLVALYLDNLVNQLRAIAQYPNLRSRDTAVVRGVLRVAYRQIEDIAVVALVDDGGTPHGDTVFLTDPQNYEALRGHDAATSADVEALFARVPGRPSPLPLERVRAAGLAFGPVHSAPSASHPRLVLAIRLPVPPGADAGTVTPINLVADVSLEPLARRIQALSSEGAEALLLDGDDRLVADAHGAHAALHSVDRPRAALAAGRAAVAPYVEDGQAMLGAYAPVQRYGFSVLVRQRADAAYAPVAALHRRTLEFGALSAVLAAALAALFTRSVAVRVRRLAAGAAEIGGGRLEVRLPASGRDEIADLSRSMNDMATHLAAQRAEILEWNRTLEARVAEKTRELLHAQDMLLRSQKLVAIGELGAGIAHEINNPLAGALGMTQLMLLDLPPSDPRRAQIQDIEQQALRIRDIVAKFLRFTQDARAADQSAERVDVQRVLDDALALLGPTALEQRGIHVERHFATDVPAVRAIPSQLQEAFVQILTNARNAMPTGGQLTVETSQQNGKLVTVRIADTGAGIRPEHLDRIFDPFFTTKAEWGATGLGLSLVHKIVEGHGGKIAVDSAPGQGAIFTLTLPADLGELHLA